MIMKKLLAILVLTLTPLFSQATCLADLNDLESQHSNILVYDSSSIDVTLGTLFTTVVIFEANEVNGEVIYTLICLHNGHGDPEPIYCDALDCLENYLE